LSGRREGPPPEDVTRRQGAGRTPEGRDITPAVGKRGSAAVWQRAGEKVALAKEHWGDARWSFLYGKDTGYASASANGDVAAAAKAARGGEEVPVPVQGPMLHAALWTWEVPVYFWVGGLASGSAFVSLACDVVGDREAAALARKVALGAAIPAAPLLIADLGRPARFLNMLRIFKPRSPMSMGAWCLVAFSTSAAGAVAADVFDLKRVATVTGGVTALFGSYLGSYTGALLAATATPLWARSRVLLAPIFVCTAVASGAATNRLLQRGGPARTALGRVEFAAMASELVLTGINERRLGPVKRHLEHHRAFKAATWATRIGLVWRALRRDDVPSLLFLLAALGYRFAWVEGGIASAHDDEAVARMARRS
jgi:formate-dependent nitrite reductase membrane component NrfD